MKSVTRFYLIFTIIYFIGYKRLVSLSVNKFEEYIIEISFVKKKHFLIGSIEDESGWVNCNVNYLLHGDQYLGSI